MLLGPFAETFKDTHNTNLVMFTMRLVNKRLTSYEASVFEKLYLEPLNGIKKRFSS